MPETRKVQEKLARIEGQVKGLQRMIAEQRACDEILTQVMAVKAALDRVTTDLVELQLAALQQGMSPEEAHIKMVRTIRLLCKM